MQFHLPFVYVVHYAAKGRPITHENTPWKIVLARNAREALTRFSKKHPKLQALFAMKI